MTSEQTTPEKQFGNILDFVYHTEGESDFRLEISVMKDGKVCVFHNKPFKNDISEESSIIEAESEEVVESTTENKDQDKS